MICPPCNKAGNENAAGNKRAAKLLHGLCNKQCDCQHHVGWTAIAGREPR